MENSFWDRHKFPLCFAGIALLVTLADQLIKYLIYLRQPQIELKVLTIHLINNTGAGFGILQNQSFFLGIISLAAVLLVLFNYPKIQKEYFLQILWALFLGGALGNLIDRWLRGFVIDFIDLKFWPAFNIADAAITVSAIGLIIWYWRR